jgi:hypothetical protein
VNYKRFIVGQLFLVLAHEVDHGFFYVAYGLLAIGFCAAAFFGEVEE